MSALVAIHCVNFIELGLRNCKNMCKNKRKRRLKEEDFKKKKLKVGKKLPMPDNVTRTSFKAKSINISQQVWQYAEDIQCSNEVSLTS